MLRYTYAAMHANNNGLQHTYAQGRRPRGDWGDGPKKTLRWGDSPCIRTPNILRSSVVGCARKYEQSKKWCHKGILF